MPKRSGNAIRTTGYLVTALAFGVLGCASEGDPQDPCGPGEFLDANGRCVPCGPLGEPIEDADSGVAGCRCHGGAVIVDGGSCDCPPGSYVDLRQDACLLESGDAAPSGNISGVARLAEGLDPACYTQGDLYVFLREACPSAVDAGDPFVTVFWLPDVDFTSPDHEAVFGFVNVMDGDYVLSALFDHDQDTTPNDPRPDEHDVVCGVQGGCACLEARVQDRKNVSGLEFVLDIDVPPKEAR